jgi:hypothetical protein
VEPQRMAILIALFVSVGCDFGHDDRFDLHDRYLPRATPQRPPISSGYRCRTPAAFRAAASSVA